MKVVSYDATVVVLPLKIHTVLKNMDKVKEITGKEALAVIDNNNATKLVFEGKLFDEEIEKLKKYFERVLEFEELLRKYSIEENINKLREDFEETLRELNISLI